MHVHLINSLRRKKNVNYRRALISCNFNFPFTIITFLTVDGVWGSWGAFTTCSKKCGGGTKTRVRRCDNPSPAYGGATCVGPANDEQKCNEDKCPGTKLFSSLFHHHFILSNSGDMPWFFSQKWSTDSWIFSNSDISLLGSQNIGIWLNDQICFGSKSKSLK